jgi:hypothetical protein
LLFFSSFGLYKNLLSNLKFHEQDIQEGPPNAQVSMRREKTHYSESRKIGLADIDIIKPNSNDQKVLIAKEMARIGIPSDSMSDDWVSHSFMINQAAKTNPTIQMTA